MLSFVGPTKWHAHSASEYQLTPTHDNKRRRRNDKELAELNGNGKEMISFIETKSATIDNEDKIDKENY